MQPFPRAPRQATLPGVQPELVPESVRAPTAEPAAASTPAPSAPEPLLASVPPESAPAESATPASAPEPADLIASDPPASLEPLELPEPDRPASTPPDAPADVVATAAPAAADLAVGLAALDRDPPAPAPKRERQPAPAEPVAETAAALGDPPLPKRRIAPVSETFATERPIAIPIASTPSTPSFTAKGTQRVKPPELPVDVKIVIAGVAVREAVDPNGPLIGVPLAPRFGPPPASRAPVHVPPPSRSDDLMDRDVPPMRNQRLFGVVVGIAVFLFFTGVLLAIIALSNE